MPAELAETLTATEEERLLQAEQTIRDFCGWHIAPSREETVTFAFPAGRRLMLPSLYVTEVSEVTVDGVPLVLDTDFQVHQNGWIDRLPYGGWWSGDLIEITFTHGYEDVPASVTAAVQALAQRSTGSPSGAKRETSGPFTEEYESGLSEAERINLARYRIPAVA